MASYAFSDLHGNYDLWKKICARTQPDDELYCLGDIIDRGNSGYKICLEMMKRPHMHFIKGNHEMMAVNALPWLLKNEYHMRDVDMWLWNGGGKTWDEIELINFDLSHPKFEKRVWKLIDWFREMATQIDIVNAKGQNVVLSHAGFTPEIWDEVGWDRNHFWDEWPKDYENTYIIHGHTPVQYLAPALEQGRIDARIKIDRKAAPAVIEYANGHKIDIDLGTIISNRIALINLDTLEVTYIE